MPKIVKYEDLNKIYDYQMSFDSEGNISDNMSYNIIRNLYFNDKRVDVGKKLLNEALDAFGCMNKIYAYFHYFGMSCYAIHGKLFEGHAHINDFLKANGFERKGITRSYFCQNNIVRAHSS